MGSRNEGGGQKGVKKTSQSKAVSRSLRGGGGTLKEKRGELKGVGGEKGPGIKFDDKGLRSPMF